jgi:hypothetical protein
MIRLIQIISNIVYVLSYELDFLIKKQNDRFNKDVPMSIITLDDVK